MHLVMKSETVPSKSNQKCPQRTGIGLSCCDRRLPELDVDTRRKQGLWMKASATCINVDVEVLNKSLSNNHTGED